MAGLGAKVCRYFISSCTETNIAVLILVLSIDLAGLLLGEYIIVA